MVILNQPIIKFRRYYVYTGCNLQHIPSLFYWQNYDSADYQKKFKDKKEEFHVGVGHLFDF